MADLLFKLSNVPEDEADEVRRVFQQGGFDVYETSTGRWGSGVAAIWLADSSQLADARAALSHYQAQRVRRMQETYAELVATGEAPTFWHKFATSPWQVIGCVLGIGIIAALMVLPFLGFL